MVLLQCYDMVYDLLLLRKNPAKMPKRGDEGSRAGAGMTQREAQVASVILGNSS